MLARLLLIAVLVGCSPAVQSLENVDAPGRASLPQVTASDYLPKLDLIALGFADGTIELRSPAPHHVLSRTRHEARPTQLALSPDGSRLAVADALGKVLLFEVTSGAGEVLREGTGAGALDLAWDASSTRLTVVAAGVVRVHPLKAASSRELRVGADASCLAFSRDQGELVVAGRELVVVDSRAWRVKRRIGLPAPAVDVRYSADDQSAAVLLERGVAFVNLSTGEVDAARLEELAPIGLRYAPDGRVAVFGRGAVYVGPARAGDVQSGARPTAGAVYDLQFRQDGSLMFVGDTRDAELASLGE